MAAAAGTTRRSGRLPTVGAAKRGRAERCTLAASNSAAEKGHRNRKETMRGARATSCHEQRSVLAGAG
eukprot:48999-Prymnesium_polylepis.1